MARRTAGWNDRTFVKGRLQAALYWNRKNRQERAEDDKPNETETEPQTDDSGEEQ